MTTAPRLDISVDAGALATRIVEWIVERIAVTPGPFALNLSGGSTPKRAYELLATEAYRDKVDWRRVHIFFGDERFVPMDHPDSNYRMAREALISHVPIPEGNVHPIETERGDPADAAAAYQATLKTFYGQGTLDPARPLFGVTLLGLGEDGHTASLFPGTAALAERERWVTSVIGAKPEPRITMTYPVLASSGVVAFLVEGTKKRVILKRVLDKDPALPAAHVMTTGEFLVFCDEAAAAFD